MRVHSCRNVSVVFEDDANSVTHLRSNQRTENTQMLPLLRTDFLGFEGGVGVLVIDRLVISPMKLCPAGLILCTFNMGQTSYVPAARRVVPIDLICRDV